MKYFVVWYMIVQKLTIFANLKWNIDFWSNFKNILVKFVDLWYNNNKVTAWQHGCWRSCPKSGAATGCCVAKAKSTARTPCNRAFAKGQRRNRGQQAIRRYGIIKLPKTAFAVFTIPADNAVRYCRLAPNGNFIESLNYFALQKCSALRCRACGAWIYDIINTIP